MLKYDGYQIVFQEVPDEISLAFNITGCPHCCDGCHSPHLQEDGGRPLMDDLLKIVAEHYDEISCVCFMGGDADPRGLAEAIIEVKMLYPNLKIAVYSGDDDPNEIIWRLSDYVKTGSYDKKRGGLKERTTNQHMYEIYFDGDDITKKFWPKEI